MVTCYIVNHIHRSGILDEPVPKSCVFSVDVVDSAEYVAIGGHEYQGEQQIAADIPSKSC